MIIKDEVPHNILLPERQILSGNLGAKGVTVLSFFFHLKDVKLQEAKLKLLQDIVKMRESIQYVDQQAHLVSELSRGPCICI